MRHDVRATASGVWMDAQRRGADPVCRRSACESVHGGVSRALLLDVLREALALELTCRHRRFVRAVRWGTRGLVLRRILASRNARALAWRWGGSGRCVRPVAPGVVMTAVKVECACLAPETWLGYRQLIHETCQNMEDTPAVPAGALIPPGMGAAGRIRAAGLHTECDAALAGGRGVHRLFLAHKYARLD